MSTLAGAPRDTHGAGPSAGPKERTGHDVHRDLRGEDQPANKSRAQQPSGEQAQRDAARDQPPSPGEPAQGEDTRHPEGPLA
jgi:hypothetical protein